MKYRPGIVRARKMIVFTAAQLGLQLLLLAKLSYPPRIVVAGNKGWQTFVPIDNFFFKV